VTNKDELSGGPGSSSQNAQHARKDFESDATGVDSVSGLQQHGDFAKPVESREFSGSDQESEAFRVASKQDMPVSVLDDPTPNAVAARNGAAGIQDDAAGLAASSGTGAEIGGFDAADARPYGSGANRNAERNPSSSDHVPSSSARQNSGSKGTAQRTNGQYQNRHGTRSSASGDTATKYAALDLGTNNCRLLIAEPRDHGFRIVDSFSRIVRLGEGISANNRLGDEAADRAISALRVCWNKLKYHKVEKVRLIATEACRSAENGDAFLQRVTQEIGLELEIIDRETEARLAVTGCSSLVEPRSDGVVLFDIGGGSSEIVWMDRRGRRKRNRLGGTLRAWDSLPVGVVTLSERFNGKNVTRESFEAMVNEVQGLLAAFPKRRELQQALSRGRHHLLGTSGTVTTLAGVHLGLRRYDRRRVDGMWMSNTDAVAMIEKLLALTYEQRVGHPCIGQDRADLVLPGCAIFEAIRREFSCDQLRIADRGLREGILVELMSKDGHGLSRRGNRSTPWRRKRPKSKARRNANGNQGTGGTGNEQ
jgi:exopolyphosphatase/guanosine-5'-triphosphate,3'-diphosphate pyrophosphatase